MSTHARNRHYARIERRPTSARWSERPLGLDRELPVYPTDPVMEARRPQRLLRRLPRRARRQPRLRPQRDHRADRSVGLWQVDRPALPQPDERPRRRRARRGRGASTTARTSTRKGVDPIAVRTHIGMVFQKPNPFPKSIYDNIAYGPRVTGMKVDNMDDLVEEALRGCRALGRGQGQAQAVGVRPLRRSAAAALHRADDRHQARRDPDGRAVLGARPDRHRARRGPDDGAARRLHDHHRHPQHAAGGPRLGPDGVLHRPPRRDHRQPHRSPRGVRPHHARSSPTPATSGPRTTSPVASAEPPPAGGRQASRGGAGRPGRRTGVWRPGRPPPPRCRRAASGGSAGLSGSRPGAGRRS